MTGCGDSCTSPIVLDTSVRQTKAFRLPLSFKVEQGRRDEIPHEATFLLTTNLPCFFLMPDSRKVLGCKWIKNFIISSSLL